MPRVYCARACLCVRARVRACVHACVCVCVTIHSASSIHLSLLSFCLLSFCLLYPALFLSKPRGLVHGNVCSRDVRGGEGHADPSRLRCHQGGAAQVRGNHRHCHGPGQRVSLEAAHPSLLLTATNKQTSSQTSTVLTTTFSTFFSC